MRQIKFRAWSIDEERMFEVSQIHFVASGEHWVLDETEKLMHPDTTKLMQYTGLKDKNGKEIYEGDIVKFVDSENGIEWDKGVEIKFSNAAFWLGHAPIVNFSTENISSRFEIIGNIYENPELLKNDA